MRIAIILSTLAMTAGCAMSMNDLAKTKVDRSFESAKSPADVAQCISGTLNGNVPMQKLADDHYVVSRHSLYGPPMIRWDVRSKGTGSRIEVRRSVGVMVGETKAEGCF